MTDKVLLEVHGPVAVITNNNPDKRNAFDDDMDARLFDILSELQSRPEVRAGIRTQRAGRPGRRVGTCRSSGTTPRPSVTTSS